MVDPFTRGIELQCRVLYLYWLPLRDSICQSLLNTLLGHVEDDGIGSRSIWPISGLIDIECH